MDGDQGCVGFGTMLLKESCEAAVSSALEHGIRIIDTGEHYENLELVGKGLAKNREFAFVVTKLSGLPSGDYEAVKTRMQAMLTKLGIEVAPLCLIHWPGLCTWDVTDSSPLESPEAFAEKQTTSWEGFKAHIASAWANMSRLKEDRLVSEIGTSNFYPHHLAELALQCDGAKPYANEIFIDATNQEVEFVAEMHSRGIKVLAYRPVRYPFPESVETLAARHGVSKQTVVFAWLCGRGIFPLVKCRGEHIEENVQAPKELQAKLTPEDMAEIGAAEVGIRKGSEWFAKIWSAHNETGPNEEDIAQLVMFGVDEARAREVLEKCSGNMELAMDMAFS